MIEYLTKNIIKIYFEEFGSNCYVIKEKNKNILIDTGSIETRNELLESLEKLDIHPNDVNYILLTHFHWDHMANIELFKDALIYASNEEIKDFKKDRTDFVRMKDLDWLADINKIKILDIKEFEKKHKSFKVILTPGHTRGSISILYKGVLFSGDTLFNKDGSMIGRTDLKTSEPKKIYLSVNKLLKLKFKILCPGH
jgi:glyoxylase-like metal-dependent hydrolase (beta-lactamase superfamily II)